MTPCFHIIAQIISELPNASCHLSPEMVWQESDRLCFQVDEEGAHFFLSESTRSQLIKLVSERVSSVTTIILKTRYNDYPIKLKGLKMQKLGALLGNSLDVDYFQALWNMPVSATIAQMDTNKILCGNHAFASLTGLTDPLKPWGMDASLVWIRRDLERMHQALEAFNPGDILGSAESPFEYQARSTKHIVESLERGETKAEAIASAPIFDIGAVYQKILFAGQVCRLAVHLYKRSA